MAAFYLKETISNTAYKKLITNLEEYSTMYNVINVNQKK